jgi:hypothetical protein
MANIFIMLLNIYTYTGIIEFHGETNADSTPGVPENIWKQWHNCEQPLFVLAFALHPKYWKSTGKQHCRFSSCPKHTLALGRMHINC